MADVATVTGIVGTLTGVTGAVLGFLGYRQSMANKVLDLRLQLRLQLRRDVNALKAIFDPLHQAIDAGVQSRTRVLAATGLGRSGNQIMFEQAADTDKAIVANLAPRVAALERDYFSLTDRDLELQLSEVNRLTLEASRLAAKYREAMAADDAARQQIRAEHITMAAAYAQAPQKTR